MSARFLGRRASRTLRIAVTLGVLWQALSLAAAVPPAYAALPDNRAYELVSPPTEGEPYLPATLAGPEREEGFSTSLAFRAGAGGEAVVYTGEPGVSTGTGSIGPGLGNQWYVARTATGWLAEDITPSNSSRQGAYQSFSDDLATGFYEGEKTPLTEDVEPGCVALYSRASAGGIFTSLFTAGETPRHCGKPLFAGAADGGSPVIFQSEAALAPGSEAATEVPPPNVEGQDQGLGESCLYGCNLYESIGGHLRTVNVLEGKPVPGATFGGYGPTAGEAPNFANAISSDGSRIFWTDTLKGPNMEHVYVLEDGTSNVAVSSGQPAEYWGASPDGHYAFYTEVGRLWRFDSRANEREPLTPEGAGAQGVVGINQTGEAGGYVYFVASAVLAGEPNARGEHATPGGFNLYLLHADATTFIAGLASEDNELLVKREQHNHGGAWRGGLGERVAEVTPDGRHLAFQSVRELTGYNSGRSNLPEVFVYAAASAQLTCASCSPTGAPFASVVGEGLESKVPVSAGAQTYVERWLSEDGNRVFFSSPAPLTPEDTNAAVDVYEWERPAAPGEPNNTCTAAQASAVTGGCTFLLSGGTANSPASVLVDADATGNNVFFEHFGQLGSVEAPVDHNQLYDARVNGGFPETSLACSGAGCQGVPPAAPSFATPASVTFNGSGNFPPSPVTSGPKKKTAVQVRSEMLAARLKACKKLRNSRRRSCERKARRKYGPARAKRSRASAGRAGNDRRRHS